MKKKNIFKLVAVLAILVLPFAISAAKNKAKTNNEKPALIWVDSTANFKRFSNTDTIDFYLNKIKNLGFTHVIVDMLPISGEVLYKSKFAPQLKEWDGYTRPDFDFLGYFIKSGHKLGLNVYASMNVFCAGHNYINTGIIYNGHPEYASIVYNPEKGLIPITEEKHKYGAMVNPSNVEFQKHILNVMKELVTKYPNLDGLMLDRVRYDGISSDFSELSRSLFEKYTGEKVQNFPNDILSWSKTNEGKYVPVRGKLFNKWIEWRAMVIKNFMAKAHKEVKTANKNVTFGTYTGAWYPSYYEVGVNFASKNYDPSKDYDWATPNYKNTAYAEDLEMYITGNYYTDITIDEYKKSNRSVWNETDSQAQQGTWYCVEGSCANLKKILMGNKFIGGILVDQFYETPSKLSETIYQNLLDSDGLMVFDIVHIIDKNLWNEVEMGMKKAGKIK
ncbi:MAG: alpha amylase family protein [Muribaculaceae bacterium]|nr:alpha amylase family protein [Muribaculaceae bacterium]